MTSIAITGPVASGIENINEILTLHDYPVFEADIAIKYLINWREDILRELRIQFSESIFQDGFINNNKFRTTEKFDRLLDVIDVDLFLLWRKFCTKHMKAGIVFFKSHIVYERGWAGEFDKVIYIDKSRDKRARAISEQTFKPMQDVLSLLDSELSYKEKIKKADYVIYCADNLSMLTQFENIRWQIKSDKSSSKLNDFIF